MPVSTVFCKYSRAPFRSPWINGELELFQGLLADRVDEAVRTGTLSRETRPRKRGTRTSEDRPASVFEDGSMLTVRLLD